jgi:prepilin-type N-terminal cleavage/methylation domain-containing protein
MNRNAGFSLLEVLAALVVTALLIMALTPLVGVMLTTWVRGSDVAGIVELRVRGVGVLRDDLRHAVIWAGFGRTENLPAFRGNETSMSFPAVSGLGEGQDGIEMISIDVASSTDGRSLIRRRAPVIGTTYAAFSDPVVLFSGPFKYFLRYYSIDGTETSEWHDPLSFPSRVVLNIVDGRGRSSGVAVTLPVLASISAACLAGGQLPGCPMMSKPQSPNGQDDDLLNAFGRQLSQ